MNEVTKKLLIALGWSEELINIFENDNRIQEKATTEEPNIVVEETPNYYVSREVTLFCADSYR